MNTILLIENQPIDLLLGTVIAANYQSFDLKDLKSRLINYSTQIKIPKTENNVKVFGFADNVNSNTDIPYRKLPAKLLQNGIEIMPNAVAELMPNAGGENLHGYFNIVIYSALRDLFDTLDGRYVDELDLGVYGPFDDTWLSGHANDSNPAGAPVIDYGRMFAPDQELLNSDFIGDVFDPWDNNTGDFDVTGPEWVVSGDNKIEVTLGTIASNINSKHLENPYKLYKDFEYRFVVELAVSGTDAGTAYVRGHNSEDGGTQDLGSVSITTAGDKVIDSTIVVTGDFTHIAIQAIKAGTGGALKTIKLKRIQVIPVGAINIKAPYQLPVLNYAAIITAIINETGYSYSTLFSTDDNTFLGNLAITFSKKEIKYNNRLTDKFNFRAHAAGTQALTVNSTTLQDIEFTDIILNGSDPWYDETSTTNVPVLDFDLRIKLYYRIVVNATFTGGGSARFYLMDGASVILDESGNQVAETINTDGQHVINLELPLTTIGNTLKGYLVNVNRPGGAGSATLTIVSGYVYSWIDTTPVDRIHGSNLILPDMLQKDFFKDFLIRTMSLCLENGSNGVTINPLARVIQATASAKDWTQKRDPSFMDDPRFTLYDYGQKNYLSDEPGTMEDAKDYFEINNLMLPAEKTIYTSPFQAVEQIQFQGIKIARVPVFGFETFINEDWEPGPRLIYLRDDETTDPEVKYADSVETQYLVAVYGDLTSDRQATWKYFIEKFYSPVAISMSPGKILNRRYILTESDIIGLDSVSLIFDQDSYYLLNKVENYVPEQPTKVELIKI